MVKKNFTDFRTVTFELFFSICISQFNQLVSSRRRLFCINKIKNETANKQAFQSGKYCDFNNICGSKSMWYLITD